MIITQGYGWEGMEVGGVEVDIQSVSEIAVNVEAEDISVSINVNENTVEVETN